MSKIDGLNAPENSKQSPVGNTQILQAEAGVPLIVSGDAWLLKADFSPQGSHLLLSGQDGSQVLIHNFFDLDIPPDLMTEGGAAIPAELAVKLAGPQAPGQFALLENGPFQLAQAFEPIGQVEEADGLVEAIRANGVRVTLDKGDAVFQGDTLITSKGGAVGIIFVDETTFSLGEDGRMVIDEMVYDPESQTGEFSTHLLQGVFTFVSGQIAKTSPDAMVLTTPIVTIGVRGTKVAGHAAQEGEENTIALLPELDVQGNPVVGELVVTSQGGFVTLNIPGAMVQMTSSFASPPPPIVLTPQEIQQNFGQALMTLSTVGVAKAERAAAQAEADAAEAAEEAAAAEAEAEEADAIAAAEAAEAEAAEAEAAAAEAEAEAAAAEAEVAAADAAAAAELAAAEGTEEAIAAAEEAARVAEQATAQAAAAEAAAQAEAAEAAAQIAEAEAAAEQAAQAEAEAQVAAAEAEVAAQEAEFTAQMFQVASAEFQSQSDAFAQFGTAPPPQDEPSPEDGPAPEDGPEAEDDAPPEPEPEPEPEPFPELEPEPEPIPEPEPLPEPKPYIPPPYAPPDVEVSNDFDQDQTVSQSTFDEVFKGTLGNDNLVGTSLNTNFYFAQSKLGGTDNVSATGGLNQISFDGLNNIALKVVVGASAGTGTMTSYIDSGVFDSASYSGTPTSTINYNDIGQYLFADFVVPGLADGYISQSAEDTSTAPTDADAGDIIVLPPLNTSGDIGVVMAGGSGADTFNIGDSGIDGMIVFGKGGGDTFNFSAAVDGLYIGGITATDNNDNFLADGSTPGQDGIPDTNLNKFSYSSMYAPGSVGIKAFINGFVEGGEIENSAGVHHVTADIYNNLWDVAEFVGSAGDDTIIVEGAALFSLDGGTGDDYIILNNSAKIRTISNVAGTDTLLSHGDNGTDGDMNLANTTITGITSILLNETNTVTSNGPSTGGTTTLTMSSTTNLANGTTITFNAASNHTHIESDNGMDLANQIFNNVDSILLDTGNDTVGATLTLGSSSSFNSPLQIRSMEGATGTSDDIIASVDGMNLSNVTLFGGISDINIDTDAGAVASLTVNTSTNLLSVNITGGTDLDDVITLANSGTYSFANNTLTNIASINGTSGVDNITGSAGNDVINANADIDILTGGAGNDTLNGGAGNDTFNYTATALNSGDMATGAIDTTDAAAGDIINLSSAMEGLLTTGGSLLSALSSNTALGSSLDGSNFIALVDVGGPNMQIHIDNNNDATADFIIDVVDTVTTATYDFTNDYITLA